MREKNHDARIEGEKKFKSHKEIIYYDNNIDNGSEKQKKRSKFNNFFSFCYIEKISIKIKN